MRPRWARSGPDGEASPAPSPAKWACRRLTKVALPASLSCPSSGQQALEAEHRDMRAKVRSVPCYGLQEEGMAQLLLLTCHVVATAAAVLLRRAMDCGEVGDARPAGRRRGGGRTRWRHGGDDGGGAGGRAARRPAAAGLCGLGWTFADGAALHIRAVSQPLRGRLAWVLRGAGLPQHSPRHPRRARPPLHSAPSPWFPGCCFACLMSLPCPNLSPGTHQAAARWRPPGVAQPP